MMLSQNPPTSLPSFQGAMRQYACTRAMRGESPSMGFLGLEHDHNRAGLMGLLECIMQMLNPQGRDRNRHESPSPYISYYIGMQNTWFDLVPSEMADR